jgi:hypothetical protein
MTFRVEKQLLSPSSCRRRPLWMIKNHLSQSYRNKDPFKAFYVAMEELGATISFIRLASYTEAVPIGQVLLAEAVCCSIFGSFNSERYCKLRLKELPKVYWDYGLNKCDPLRTLTSGLGLETIGNDAATYRRL